MVIRNAPVLDSRLVYLTPYRVLQSLTLLLAFSGSAAFAARKTFTTKVELYNGCLDFLFFLTLAWVPFAAVPQTLVTMAGWFTVAVIVALGVVFLIPLQVGAADMVFDVPYLFAYISACMTLMPGDLIFTGTPEGVAALQPGDSARVALEGLELAPLVTPFA